jgi:hypothetical protein
VTAGAFVKQWSDVRAQAPGEVQSDHRQDRDAEGAVHDDQPRRFGDGRVSDSLSDNLHNRPGQRNQQQR